MAEFNLSPRTLHSIAFVMGAFVFVMMFHIPHRTTMLNTLRVERKLQPIVGCPPSPTNQTMFVSHGCYLFDFFGIHNNTFVYTAPFSTNFISLRADSVDWGQEQREPTNNTVCNSFDGVTVVFMLFLGIHLPKVHYFHLVELLLPIWAAYQEHYSHLPVTHVLFPAQFRVMEQETTRIILESIFPGAVVIGEDELRSMTAQTPLYLRHAIVFDQLATQRTPVVNLWGKGTAAHLQAIYKHFPSLRNRFLTALNIQPRPRTDSWNITLIDRGDTKIRNLWQEDFRMIEYAMQAPLVNVRRVRFQDLPFRDQVVVATETDVFIAPHGNGLTHMLWAKPGSVVVEIFADGVTRVDYEMLAYISGHRYFQWLLSAGLQTATQYFGLGVCPDATFMPFGEVGGEFTRTNVGALVQKVEEVMYATRWPPRALNCTMVK